MVSMTPQLFTVVELWAKMCQKRGEIRGSKKVAKNGKKWPKMTCKNYKIIILTFTCRMIMELLFSKKIAAPERIANKILISKEKKLPPEQEICHF